MATEPYFAESVNKGPVFRSCLKSLSDRMRVALTNEGFGPIEQLVAEAPTEFQAMIFLELIIEEAQLRKIRGVEPTIDEYLLRFPKKTELIDKAWKKIQSLAAISTVDYQRKSGHGQSTETGVNPNTLSTGITEPTHFGAYKVMRPLGSGTFGSVFKAQNESSGDVVAIKMLKNHWASDPDCGQAMRRQFSQEATIMLQFNHPNVVRVIELDEEADPPYFVQQFIDGQTLADLLQSNRLTFKQSVEFAIQIANGLAHIHSYECWHRDLKPANILLDRNNCVYLADFGLALDEAQRWSSKPKVAGTYPYMSPEQIKGATHRLNARCDIWALGVILYEMLTGRRPFRSQTREHLFEDVTQRTPPAPRELNQAIPRELNRLCMQCLSKRDADRPHTAADVRDDLVQIRQTLIDDLSQIESPAKSANKLKTKSSVDYPTPTLRRFTAEQAELYLRLMPRGYATADELPKLITYWQTRIVEKDPNKTFAVGVIVGVSGCGKSSMLEAGLVPSLPDSIIPILIEASETDTEVRVLNKLRRALPDVDPEQQLSLVDWTFRIRSGKALPPEKKAVLILDQFEQWLNAHGGESSNQLLEALHQCDGEHLQAIVCVREGFHATLMRLVDSLNLALDSDLNYDTVHRFTPDHARFVLTQFGRGLKRVDDPPTPQQQAFVDRTIDGLEESDRGVVCVRLVVLALVMQDRPWSVEELNQLGGLQGIGSQFLVDCFEGRTASEQYRRYLPYAIRVLAELLPAEGLEIKDVRSYEQLLVASELDRAQFDNLLNILVRKLFLLTPVEQVDLSTPLSISSSNRSVHPHASSLFFQLTHDFLIPSIRDWLSRKLRQSKIGRAQLRLQELTTAWSSKPADRNLPTLWEWITIRWLTDHRKWKSNEQTVMRRASRLHARRISLFSSAFAFLAVLGFLVRGQILAQQEATRIEGLIDRLESAEPNQLPSVIAALEANFEIATTYLSPLLTQKADTTDEKRSQLHARLVSVAHDRTLIEYLLEELLTNKFAYIGPIRQQLRPYASELTEQLQSILRDDKADVRRRFRAALALADYVPENETSSWTAQDLQFAAGQLVSENAEFQPQLREYLRPICRLLIPYLATIFADPTAAEAHRLSAANAFADYATKDIADLLELLTVATPEQYAVLYPLVSAASSPETITKLCTLAATMPHDDLGSVARIAYGQRRANAAVTMLNLGQKETVLPVFTWIDDPEAVTQFIFSCKPRGIRVDTLLDLLEHVSSIAPENVPRDARYALLLAIGEYASSEIPPARREAFVKTLADWYSNDPSAGIHGATGWLLRQFGEISLVDRVDQTPVPYTEGCEWFTLAITVPPRRSLLPKNKVESAVDRTNGQSMEHQSVFQEQQTFYYTFIVFSPGEYMVGVVNDEPERSGGGSSRTTPFGPSDIPFRHIES
ncbi:MAG: serine/threonine-protein kinase [Pirellulales bacterium]